MESFYIDPGKLNQRISFGKMKTVKDESNYPIETFISEFPCWSNVIVKEYADRNVYSFVIRYNSKVTKELSIKFKEKIYTIDTLENLDFKNRYLRMRTKEDI